jgi:hypothetical protein
MPYYNVDPGVYEEYADEIGEEVEIPEGEYYEAAEATYNFDAADALARAVRDALLAKGFTSVECHYDGGYDEGFAYFDAAVTELSSDEVPELVQLGRELGVTPEPKRVAGPELAALLEDSRLPEAYLDSLEQANYPQASKDSQRQWLLAMAPTERTGHALEQFADELASELLGRGYGTGEYTLRGRFRADLRSGRIVDVEDGD